LEWRINDYLRLESEYRLLESAWDGLQGLERENWQSKLLKIRRKLEDFSFEGADLSTA
jgi:hypothetical protein